MKQNRIKKIMIMLAIFIILSSLSEAVVTILRDDGNPISGTADTKSVLLREETSSEKYVIRSCLKVGQTTNFYLKFDHKHTISMASFNPAQMNILVDENTSYDVDVSTRKYIDTDKNNRFDMKLFLDSVWPSYACFFVFEVTESSCNPNWKCTDWDLCSNNTQSRTCSDTKSCKGMFEPPLQKRFCYQKKPIFWNISIEKPWIIWTELF